MITENNPTGAVKWRRCSVDQAELRKLYERSDVLGALQTLGYLGVIVFSGCLAYYSAYHFPWYVTLLLVFMHGTFFAFQINAVHELGHNTVFKTRTLNSFFEHLFAFLGWINHRMFQMSHVRHHRSTLHPPDDLEVVVPIRLTLEGFLKTAFVNPVGIWYALNNLIRISRGRFEGEWELKLFPEEDKERRRWASNWSRTILIGHTLIVASSIYFKLWMLPVVTTFAPFYGSWLFYLCNNTQHVGLQDNVSDFRLCCRTFTLNPIVRFLYWHMNYHIEHHMYVGVPCYRLARLHRLIENDLPPCPSGIVATWREISAIMKRQREDPTYQYRPPLPEGAES